MRRQRLSLLSLPKPSNRRSTGCPARSHRDEIELVELALSVERAVRAGVDFAVVTGIAGPAVTPRGVRHEPCDTPTALAIASNGTVLVNVAHVDRHMTSTQLLQWALVQPGKVFVGVQMSPAEARKVLAWSRDVHTEAIAYVVGARVRHSKRKK